MNVIVQSLLGGALIGTASAGLLLVNGRIAGISGILSGATSLRPEGWQWAFLGGLVATGLAAGLIGIPAAPALQGQSPWLLALAGLLVGVGTRLGSGCTSGHGVCGLGNLSPRSLVATMTFMATAGVVVFLTHHAQPVRQLLSQAGLP